MKTQATDNGAYVYIWFSPEWVPFYVGIGKTPSRWNPARARVKDRSQLCVNLVNKYGAENVRVQRFMRLNWDDACAMECSLIAHFRRIADGGTLANFTAGGEGVVAPRAEVTAAKRARMLDPNSVYWGYHNTLNTDPEIKKRRVEGIRAAQTKRAEKMSAPAALAQRKARVKATLTSPAYRAARLLWDTPEYREKLSIAKKQYWAAKRAA